MRSKPVTSCDKAGIAPRWHQSSPQGRKAWHVAAMDNTLASGEYPNSKGDSPDPEASLLQLLACMVLAVFGLLAAFISCLLRGAPMTPRRCPAHTEPHPLTAHRGRPGILHFGEKKPTTLLSYINCIKYTNIFYRKIPVYWRFPISIRLKDAISGGLDTPEHIL